MPTVPITLGEVWEQMIADVGGTTPSDTELRSLMLAFAAAVQAATGGNAAITPNEYWVSNGVNASDSNNGELLTPFKTVLHAITAANAAGGPWLIHVGYGTFALGGTPAVIPTLCRIEGAGKSLTTLTYTGAGPAVDVGNGTLAYRAGISGCTIDITAAGAGAAGLVLNNSLRGTFSDLWVNGTANANAVNGVTLLGSNTKSTYYNEFWQCDFTSSTGGASISINDGCNANTWHGGVVDGAGYAILAQPVTTAADTCKFIGTVFQTDTSAGDGGVGAKFISLGGDGAAVTNFDFVTCRAEPGGTGPVFNFIHGSGSAQHNTINDGTYVSTTVFTYTASDLNTLWLPSLGLAVLPFGLVLGTAAGDAGTNTIWGFASAPSSGFGTNGDVGWDQANNQWITKKNSVWSNLAPNLNLATLGTSGAFAAGVNALLATGTINVTLPSPAAQYPGTCFTLKNVGTGTVTLLPHAAETIDGAASIALATQYEAVTVTTDSTNWFVVYQVAASIL